MLLPVILTAQTYTLSLSDTATATDSFASSGSTFNRTVADSASGVDAAPSTSIGTNLGQGVGDPASPSDSVSTVATYSRTLGTDTATAGDSVVTLLTIGITVGDTLSASDTNAPAATFARTVGDTASAADGVGTTLIPGNITVNLTISGNTNNYNIWNAVVAQLGSTPTVPTLCTVTVNSGVTVGAANTGAAAMVTGSGWPASSTITIVNNGTIGGAGGAGGSGGSDAPQVGGNGAAGGDAISLSYAVTINNTNGNVFGGGGGGSGGGGSASVGAAAGGGGGGGGQGSTGGAGGVRGAQAAGSPGANGGAGTGGARGDGGIYGAHSTSYGTPPNNSYGFANAVGAYGGAGGTWGNAGESFSGVGTWDWSDWDNGFQIGGDAGNGSANGAGGAAGRAVRLNGNGITWSGGNNGTQVRGSVS